MKMKRTITLVTCCFACLISSFLLIAAALLSPAAEASDVVVSEAGISANFSGTPRKGPAPLTVQYTNLTTVNSVCVTDARWYLGDTPGIGVDGQDPKNIRTEENPIWVYTIPGKYNTGLDVWGTVLPCCGAANDRKFMENYIEVTALPNPSANFTASPTTGASPLTVSFTNTSTGQITNWFWAFGDGTNSTEQNPVHVYTSAGDHTVTLTVSNRDSNASKTVSNYIKVSSVAPTAGFSATPIAGVYPLTVNFKDESSGDVTGWSWNFGDGQTGSAQNPSHTYTAAGTYTVGLTAAGPDGSNTKTAAGYIQAISSQADNAVWNTYLANNKVRSVDIESNGDKWMGTYSNGVFKYDGATWTQYKTQLPNSQVAGTAFDSLGNKWIATNGGLAKFDGAAWTIYNSSNSPLPSNSCRAVTVDAADNVWVGTNGGGAAKFNGSTWTVYDRNNSGILDNIIYDIKIDPTGTVWFAVYGDGVSKFVPSTNTWTSYTDVLADTKVWSIAFDSSGNKWLATEGGVSTFTGSAWTAYTTTNGLSNNKCFDITVASGNVIWVSTYNGVNKFDGTTWTKFGTTDGLAHQTSYAAAAETPQKIWFGTEDGVNLFEILPAAPVASFSASPRGGKPPVTVNFTDSSLAQVTAWSWAFGDGQTSTAQNPSHTYTAAGTYTVTLTVTGPGGSDSAGQPDYITVGGPIAAVSPASLSFTLAAGTTGSKTITITNTGDGNLTFYQTNGQGSSAMSGQLASGGWPAGNLQSAPSGPNVVMAGPPPYNDLAAWASVQSDFTRDGIAIPDVNEIFRCEYVPDELLIKLRPGVSASELTDGIKALSDAGTTMTIKKELTKAKRPGRSEGELVAPKLTKSEGEWVLAKFNGADDIKKVHKELSKDSRIAYVEPNYKVKINKVPNDPMFGQQWALQNTAQTLTTATTTETGGIPNVDIDAPRAWDIWSSGEGVVVGVIDTGIDYTHPDLAGAVWTNPDEIPGNNKDDDGNGYIDDIHGWDFANGDNDPKDDHGHGSHCSGIIAGTANNGIGIAGIAWGAKVAGLKFLSADGSGYTADAVEATNYANAMGFAITSNSWGGFGYSQALRDAIDDADSLGYLYIAAAGNSYISLDRFIQYPAGYGCANIISVAATGRFDELRYWSNYSCNRVDLAAPGSLILSTILYSGDKYDYWSGTSMAAPQVSGVVALLKGFKPALTGYQIKDAILASVEPLTDLNGKTLTGGRLNACDALKMVLTEPLLNASPAAAALGAGASKTITVTADAARAAAGSYSLNLSFKTNSKSTAVLQVPVTVTVTAGVRKLSVSPLVYDFGFVEFQLTVDEEEDKNSLNIKLANDGSEPTTVSSVSFSDSRFRTTRPLPFAVPAHNSIYLSVDFFPADVSKKTCTMTIGSNASDNPVINVTLKAASINWTGYNIPTGASLYCINANPVTGDIWAGWSGGGASRFNGTSWTTYMPADGLGSDVVRDINFDPAGNVWLATYAGISKFNGTTFTNYSPSTPYLGACSVSVDKDGAVWAGTEFNGLYKLIPSTNTWTSYSLPAAIGSSKVNDIAVDSYGNKWFVTDDGAAQLQNNGGFDWSQFANLVNNWLNSCSAGNNWCQGADADYSGTVDFTDYAIVVQNLFSIGTWKTYIDQFPQYPTASHDCPNRHRIVLSVAAAPDGSKWFLHTQGVTRFDGTSVWTTYDETHGFPIERDPWYPFFEPYISTGHGYNIDIEANGTVWVATSEDLRGGIYRFTPQTGLWTRYNKFTTQSNYLYEFFSGVCVKSPGKIWAGSAFNGPILLELPPEL